ncbi:MAG: ATP-binding protein [Burkholderiaceae bacterium]
MRPQTEDRLAARMRSRIARTFVGREAELALFADSLATDPPTAPIFVVHGPGGIGKTSFLERARALAAAQGIDSVRIDARDVEGSVHGLSRALADALGAPAAGTDLRGLLAHCAGASRRLLVIDSFEHVEHLAGWLREHFLAELPAAMRVLIGGRNTPDAAWRTDPLWREAAHVAGLRNLGIDECVRYLETRGIAPAHREAIVRLTHGHPLALTLVADVVAASGEMPEQLGRDVVRELAARFTAQAPSELHRRALEVCARARVTTEPLLADTVDRDRAHALFDWLASLSVIECGPAGLFPHDLVRDAIDDELHWRHRERHRDLHLAIRDHLIQRARDPAQAGEHSFDILFLHRHAAAMQPFVDFRALGSVYFERGTADDLPVMLAALQGAVPATQHAAIAHWWTHRACTGWIVRPAAGQCVAATMSIDLAALRDEERDGDPMMAAVWRALQQLAPPRPGDRQLLARWNLVAGGLLRPSAAMNGLQMSQFHQWLTMPDLGAFVICTEHPEHWPAMMRYIGFERMPSCDRVIDGVPLGCYVHDWRAMPMSRWLDAMVDRELGRQRSIDDPFVAPAVARLARPEFDRAVRDALRTLNDRTTLAASPLTASAFVTASRHDGEGPGATLRRVIVETVAALQQRPRDAKFGRALELTYVRPAGSQERAAERLGLPFGTYRYQLATGIERLAGALWERETG